MPGILSAIGQNRPFWGMMGDNYQQKPSPTKKSGRAFDDLNR
jgi:hypothetical protein